MFQSWEITIYQICIRQFLIMIIFIMSIAKRQKRIIGKEDYIVFQSTDVSLDQYYNFISQSYAVIVYYQLKSALSLVQQSGS